MADPTASRARRLRLAARATRFFAVFGATAAVTLVVFSLARGLPLAEILPTAVAFGLGAVGLFLMSRGYARQAANAES